MMPRKSAKKKPLTDAQRHKRFVEVARERGADDASALDRALRTIAKRHPPKNG